MVFTTEKPILEKNNITEYPIHYKMLKFVANMGAEFTKVSVKIKFNLNYFIRDYIDLNSEMKANAKTEPERDTFKPIKLMNNPLLGKQL